MGPASDRFGVVLLAVMVEGGLIVLAELLGLYLDRPPRALFKWDGMGLVWGLAATLPISVADASAPETSRMLITNRFGLHSS